MATITTNSSAMQPVGNTYRGIGADYFNAGNIAREDFQRQIQMIDFENAFSASEAQKNRDWEERMSNTAYQRAVEDMKKAGLNPILAYGQGSASTPQSGSPSSSRGSYNGTVADTGSFLNALATVGMIMAGLYNTGAKNATSLKVANTVRKSENYNQNWNFNKGSKRR